MVKTDSKILSIRSIFEKDDKGYFTNNALFYQDILKYPINSNNKEFKLTTIGNYLLEFNDELIKRYDLDKKRSSQKNISKSKRFANIRDRLKGKIEDLIKLELLSSGRVSAEKIDTQIPSYSLTGDGNFVAFLLTRMDDSAQYGKVNDILYELVQSTLKFSDSLQAKFLSRLYEEYVKQDLLDNVFDTVESIMRNDSNLKTIFKAIEMVPNMTTNNTELNKKLYNISMNIFRGLDERTRNSQVAHIKSTFENRIFGQYPPERWELFRNKNDHNFSYLYGRCHNCGWEDFLQTDTLSFVYGNLNNSMNIHCLKCNSKQFHVSTELPGRPVRIICDHLIKLENKAQPRSTFCEECEKQNNSHNQALQICMTCGHVGCGKYGRNHAAKHFKQIGHPLVEAVSVTQRKWCYIHKQYYL